MWVWPEQTTTSPSGYHLTHSKAVLMNKHSEIESAQAQLLENQRNILIQWQVDLISLAIANSYSHNRWKTMVNVILLKESNNIEMLQLHVIH